MDLRFTGMTWRMRWNPRNRPNKPSLTRLFTNSDGATLADTVY